MRLNKKVSLVASGDMALSMTHPCDCNAYLIDCGTESVLIDTGTGLDNERVICELKKDMASPLTHILVTHHHADHIGGLNEIREYFHAQVVTSFLEKESIEKADETVTGLEAARNAGYYPSDYGIKSAVVDKVVKAGEHMKIGDEEICVFDATGHSLGGVCYYFPKDKMVFVGDLIMHGGYINLQNIPGANLQKYAESVIALEKLEVEQFFSGHGNFSLNRGKIHIEKAAKAFRNLGVPPNFV